MPSLFAQRFVDIAKPNLITRFGEAVTVYRGRNSGTATGRHTDVEYETETPEGLPTAIAIREWLIAIEEYEINEEAVQPRAGDQLLDGNGLRWEVLPVAGRPAVERRETEDWLIRTKIVPA